MTFPVTFCTAHVDREHPTIRAMEEIAWILRTDPGRRRIGFVQAKQLPPEERYALDVD